MNTAIKLIILSLAVLTPIILIIGFLVLRNEATQNKSKFLASLMITLLALTIAIITATRLI